MVSVQLGTNTYFVTQVLKLGKPCGAHPHFYGTSTDKCVGLPCSCSISGVVDQVVDPTSACFNTTASWCVTGTCSVHAPGCRRRSAGQGQDRHEALPGLAALRGGLPGASGSQRAHARVPFPLSPQGTLNGIV